MVFLGLLRSLCMYICIYVYMLCSAELLPWVAVVAALDACHETGNAEYVL